MKKVVALVIVICMALWPQIAFGLGDVDQNQGQSQGQLGINSNDIANSQGQQQGQVGINRNMNDLSNRNSQGQAQGIMNSGNSQNRNSNRQGQAQGQGQGQAQGQGQGQAQGQVAAQGNEQGTSVNVGGDDNDYRAYAFAPPALNAEKGTEPLNAYSIFGGIGISNTEEYQICIETITLIAAMKKEGFLTTDEARAEALKAFAQLKDATKTKRVLGFLWKTRGRHLFNLLGLLSMEDLRKSKEEIGEPVEQ